MTGPFAVVPKTGNVHRVQTIMPSGASLYHCGAFGRAPVQDDPPSDVARWCFSCLFAHDGFMVYRVWSKAGDLLYVGCTNGYADRVRQHRTKPWWPEVARVTVEHFTDIYEASEAEQVAIATEKPLHNGRGRTGVTASYAAMYAADKWVPITALTPRVARPAPALPVGRAGAHHP